MRKPVRLLILFLITAVLVAGVFADRGWGAVNGSAVVRVGSEPEFPPYAFVDEKGQPAGFSVDLIRAVADAMGLSITISTGPWDKVWQGLVKGNIDVLPIAANLPERSSLVDFSLPHTETYDAFFVRQGRPRIRDIAAAKGKEIVVMRSDAAHHALLERKFQGRLLLVDTIPQGLSLIASGRHDAFLCSKLIGIMTIRGHGLKGLSAGPPIPDYKRVFSFAVKKGDAELLEKLNQGLLIVKSNGEYDRIYEKWLAVDDPWRRLAKYRLPAIAAALTALLIGAVWLLTLQRLVRKRTADLAERNEMLRLAGEELEKRVSERTAELSRTNLELQREIEERKEAEAALHATEERYRTLSDATFEGIAITEHGRVLDVNDQLLRMTGYSRQEIIGRTLEELLPPEDWKRIMSNVTEGLESRIELAITAKDGSALIVEAHGKTVVDECRAIRVTAIRDITGRKKADAEILRQMEELTAVNDELTRINRVAVDRELRMLRLKKQVNELSVRLGEPPRYRLDLGGDA